MGANLGSGGGPMADINVTPLIDVVLVLLVVFMVITPMMESGLSVDLPEATQTKKMQDKGQFVIVGISAEKGLWVDDEEATEETLVDLVNQRFNTKTDLEGVMIKADHDLPYGDVRKYMDILGEANMTTLLIAANKTKD